MSDVFDRHQRVLDALKQVGASVDVFGAQKKKRRPCEEVPPRFGLEVCASCPDPCPEPETPKLVGEER